MGGNIHKHVECNRPVPSLPSVDIFGGYLLCLRSCDYPGDKGITPAPIKFYRLATQFQGWLYTSEKMQLGQEKFFSWEDK